MRQRPEGGLGKMEIEGSRGVESLVTPEDASKTLSC